MRYFLFFFFFNDTATTEIYTLSLHDALPILRLPGQLSGGRPVGPGARAGPEPQSGSALGKEGRVQRGRGFLDRKSTRLNSSHSQISYAVFCLKKKKIIKVQVSVKDTKSTH